MRSCRQVQFLCLRLWVGISVVMGVIAVCAPSAQAVDEIWFSTSSTVPGSPGNITVNYNSLGSQTLYVWITSNVADEVTPPILGYTDIVLNGVTNHIPNSSAGLSVNYQVTLGSSISLTGATDINPVLIGSSPATTRWDAVSISTLPDANAVASSVALDNSSPPNVVSSPSVHRGLSSANVGTGGNPTDPNYVSGDWLLGTITFNTTAIGSSTLAAQPGSLGIFQNSRDMTNLYSYQSAMINVVPEPTSLVLFGLGGLTLLMAARRRLA
jgi:PEP-CTERM motif